MDNLTLKEHRADWVEWDGAAFHLARALGLIGSDVRFHLEAKHVFWSANPIGDMLQDMLKQLVTVGVLEYRDEPASEYRWNPHFKGTWEI